MANRYFKKLTPGTAAHININGTALAITFDTLDHVLGYYHNPDEAVTNELLRLIREQRGGITEISEEEYVRDYAEKKTTKPRLLSPWREELSRSAGLGLVNREISAQAGGDALDALAVKGRSDILPRHEVPIRMESPANGSAPKATTPEGSAPAPEEFKPNLGKRNAPRPKNKPPEK
jgi:hypothetical protein